MKKILIATDFSPAARNATDYALQLAAPFKAEVTLMSAYEEIPILVPDAMAVTGNSEEQDLVQRRLEQEVENLMTDKPKAIAFMAREGSATQAILEAATVTNADLIVAGITGNEKQNRRIFGSTATGLARKSSIPVLIVPENARYEKPVGIALADDVIQEKHREIPAFVQKLSEQFKAKIFLIRIFNREAGEIVEVLHQSANRRQTIGAFSPIGQTPMNDDVAKALESFIEVNPISLLAIRPKQRSLPEQWLFGSTTRDMIFESSIPLLILPDTKK